MSFDRDDEFLKSYEVQAQGQMAQVCPSHLSLPGLNPERAESLQMFQGYPSTDQIFPLLNFLDMENAKKTPRVLVTSKELRSPFVEQATSTRLHASEILGPFAIPDTAAHGECLPSASPLSLYFPDYSMDDLRMNVLPIHPMRFGLPASRGIQPVDTAQCLRSNDSYATCNSHYTSKAKIMTDARELEFGLEEALPELRPTEAAANRWRRYQVRRRQRAKCSRVPYPSGSCLISRRNGMHSFPNSTAPVVATAGRSGLFEIPYTGTNLRSDHSNNGFGSAKSTNKLLSGGCHGEAPRSPTYVPPTKGRRKYRDKMLELEQVNAMLRKKVESLFAEMGQMRYSLSAPHEAVTSQLTSFGRAQAASVEQILSTSARALHEEGDDSPRDL